ncbi:MAG: chloride channel protein [Phycisphaerales bacterium]
MPSSAARLRDRVTRIIRERHRAGWWLTVLGAIVGIVTAFGAIGFDFVLHEVTHWSGEAQGRMPLWLLPAIPMIGALITGVLVFFFAREAGGHGVPQVLDALIRRSGFIPARIGITKVLASIATVGTGGSAGTEGPIIQIGSTTGSVLARRLGVPREHVGTLVGCGAAAGVSAIFNAPLAGVFFAMEILLRDFSLKTFTPIVIASVFATAVAHEFGGSSDAIFEFELVSYTFAAAELPSYVVLGLVCAVVATAFTHLLHAGEDLAARIPVHPVLKPVLGALLLGLLGIAYLGAGVPGVSPVAHPTPAFFGNGYETILTLLDPAQYGPASANRVLGGSVLAAVWIAVLLCACKAVATTFTLGTKGSGGVFAPSLFLGACAGAGFGLALEELGLLPVGSSPASYALVGMAAVVAGTTFAPLTAILLLFEMTQEPRVLAPIMLAAIVSTAMARVLMRDSIYTYRLRQAGILIGTDRDLTLLRRVPVSRVTPTALPREPVYASDPLSKLITLHAHHNVPDFPVVDADGKSIGMVTGGDMRTALIDREAIPLLLVAELLRDDLPTIDPTETLDTVLDKFARHDASSLTLVDAATGKPTALITRSSVMACYQRELEAGG